MPERSVGCSFLSGTGLFDFLFGNSQGGVSLRGTPKAHPSPRLEIKAGLAGLALIQFFWWLTSKCAFATAQAASYVP